VRIAGSLLYPLAICAAVVTTAGCSGPTDRPILLEASDPFAVAWTWGDAPGIGRTTGKPLDGFALSVIPDRLTLRLSDPQGLQIDVELKNISGHPQGMYFGARRSIYKLRILNLGNQKSQWQRLEQGPFGPGARFSLPRDGSLILSCVILRAGLASWFSRSGRYLVQATLTGPPLASSGTAVLRSNSVAITVLKDPPERRGIFAASLKSTKAVYRLGEAIALGLTITNDTNESYAVEYGAPSGLCDLLILDSANQLVRPVGVNYPGKRFPLPGPYQVAPKSSFTAMTYYGHSAMFGPHSFPPEWKALGTFGYALRRPGDYRITCIPRMRVTESSERGPVSFLTSSADRSNEINIRVARWSLFGFPLL
jgi:hypothetical protein